MSNRIRSGFSKGLFIFLVVILVSTGGLIWPLWLLDMGIGFQVIGTIFLVPFFFFSLYLILDALFHYEVVEGDEIKEIRFFSKKVAKMKDISGIDAPSYQISPRVTMPRGPSWPMAAFTKVDLPLPDSPTMHTISPGSTGNDTSCTAAMPL